MLRKQPFIIAALLLLFVSLSSAQSPEIDSLKNELVNLPQDTNRLNILMAMSGKLYRVNPDTGIVYSQKAIDLATQLDKKEDLGYALKNIGLAHYFKSEFSDVLLYWQESLDAFKSIDHTKGISNLLNNLGAVYYSQGDNPRALEYYLESLKFAEKISDQSRIATAYVNIGAVYAEDEDTYKEARENYLKALEVSEQLGAQDAIGTTALNLAELYIKEKNPMASLPYLEKALATFEEIKGNVSGALNLYGEAYKDLGEIQKAIEYHESAISTAIRDKTDLELSQAYIKKGNALLANKQDRAAIRAFERGLETAELFDGNNERKEAFEGLSNAYGNRKQYKQAFDYQTLFTKLSDDVRSQENEERMGKLRIQFDIANKEKEIALLNSENELKAAQIERDSNFQKFLLAIGGLLLLLLGGIFFQYRYVQKSHARIDEERKKAEDILLNILPKDTADELKAKGHVDSREYDQTTVMFTDFKGFTQVSENIPGNELVASIDYYFKKFDEIITKFNLEKIKTIGDSYMCAGGLPTANKSNPVDAVKASIEIMKFVNETHANPPEGIYPFEVRIGMNTGALVAGVVGTKKFQYDIWGSTVNIASRMESSAEEGKINISDNTYQLIKDYFECKYRGELEVKNAGMQKMYYVERGLPSLATTY